MNDTIKFQLSVIIFIFLIGVFLFYWRWENIKEFTLREQGRKRNEEIVYKEITIIPKDGVITFGNGKELKRNIARYEVFFDSLTHVISYDEVYKTH